MTRILAIHGILTATTSVSWPATFAAYMEAQYPVDVEAHYYEATPISPWNVLVKNPRIAKGIAARLAVEIGGSMDDIYIVAHSNGTHIGLLVAKYLARDHGLRVKVMVLIGSVLHSDVDRSGLAALITDGWVGRAVAYVSRNDHAVRRLQSFPGFYGSLGARGFECDGQPIGLRILGSQPFSDDDFRSRKYRYITRSYPAYGHSDYFEDPSRLDTYACVARDFGIGGGEGLRD